MKCMLSFQLSNAVYLELIKSFIYEKNGQVYKQIDFFKKKN